MKITSLNNQKVVYWAKLKMKKYRDIENTFIIEGENLVDEALKKGIVKEIITTQSDVKSDVPVYEVTLDIMKRISSLFTPSKIMAVCKFILPDDIKGKVLILDNIQDPGNLGTIIRSAVAFDFNSIILSDSTVDVYNDKVIRASEGMIFNINILRTNLSKYIPVLKNEGFKIYSTDVISGKSIKNVNEKKCAFVIGNEGTGVENEIKKLCDDFIYLPISEKCESLNAAVASSIIMYEMYNKD